MKFLRLQLLVAALILFAANASFASFSYNVSIDTSTLSGTLGGLDFQYNPGSGSSSYTTTLDISGVTGGTLSDPSTVFTAGNVSGELPSTVTITDNNISQLNEYFHNFTYGSNLSFNLTFASDPTTNSSLYFSMFQDAAGTVAALTSDPNGYAAIINMNGAAAPAVTNNITVQNDVTPTPIPAAAWLLGSGLMGLAGIRRRMNV